MVYLLTDGVAGSKISKKTTYNVIYKQWTLLFSSVYTLINKLHFRMAQWKKLQSWKGRRRRSMSGSLLKLIRSRRDGRNYWPVSALLMSDSSYLKENTRVYCLITDRFHRLYLHDKRWFLFLFKLLICNSMQCHGLLVCIWFNYIMIRI